MVGESAGLLTLTLDVYESEQDIDDQRPSQSVLINDRSVGEDLHDLMDDHL